MTCFDDIQAIADWMPGRSACSRCGSALERSSTLLFAARENPAHVDFQLKDLKSRLSSSSVPVRELNDDEQLEALSLRARLRGLDMPVETARYLQRRFPRDMRTLCEIRHAG